MKLYNQLRLLKELKSLVTYVFTSSAAYDAWFVALRTLRSGIISEAVVKKGVKLNWELINNENL